MLELLQFFIWFVEAAESVKPWMIVVVWLAATFLGSVVVIWYCRWLSRQ